MYLFQSANETIAIKSKVIEDQTDSIRKLKQVSLLNFPLISYSWSREKTAKQPADTL